MKSDRFVAISGNDPDAYFANSAIATRLAPSNVEISSRAAAPSQAAGAAGPTKANIEVTPAIARSNVLRPRHVSNDGSTSNPLMIPNIIANSATTRPILAIANIAASVTPVFINESMSIDPDIAASSTLIPIAALIAPSKLGNEASAAITPASNIITSVIVMIAVFAGPANFVEATSNAIIPIKPITHAVAFIIAAISVNALSNQIARTKPAMQADMTSIVFEASLTVDDAFSIR